MLKKQMEKALNDQVNAEMYSAYLYLSMAAWFEAENMKGMAGWMRAQAQEENMHAEKFYDFIHERDGRVLLRQIDAPPTDWKSPVAAFEEVLAHERKVTRLIHSLVDLSLKHKDHAANAFLQWFVSEQVEEESSAKEILDNLKFVGDNPSALFMLDRELGQRGSAASNSGD